MSSQIILAGGALSGCFAVAAGAFAAHGLKSRLSSEMLAIFETAARYQMYHALLLVLVGVLFAKPLGSRAFLQSSAGFLGAGTMLFCGSLYVLALTGQRWLGAVTPLGGLCFLLGWLSLAYAVLKPV